MRLITLTALLFSSLSVITTSAQLPTATGRQITLSQPQWKLFIPNDYNHRPGGKVDLLVHFHGDPQTVWNNAAHAGLNTVIVTVNYSGLSSAYSTPFSTPALFHAVLSDARAALIAQPDFDSSLGWDQTAVSSFSAGYGAVREILSVSSYFHDIDAVLAADSLYATTAADGTALDSQMQDYKAYADQAAAGEKRFVFTHSQVETFTYESTVETGDELLGHLDLATEPTFETGLGPLQYYRKAARGNFALWGAAGATGDDHLAHLRYLGEWLGDLGLARHGLEGDFNSDGVVDAADYVAWREEYPGRRMLQERDLWEDNLGAGQQQNTTAVPEPATLTGAAASVFLGIGCRRASQAVRCTERRPRACSKWIRLRGRR